MTNREIIRAEIERRMKCFKNERNTITKASDNNLSLGARIAMCEELLSFIDSLQEETVSNNLEEAAEEWDESLYRSDAFKAGAKWHKKQMMAKTVETTFNVSLPLGLYDKLWIKGCKDGDKLLVIKKDEL